VSLIDSSLIIFGLKSFNRLQDLNLVDVGGFFSPKVRPKYLSSPTSKVRRKSKKKSDCPFKHYVHSSKRVACLSKRDMLTKQF